MNTLSLACNAQQQPASPLRPLSERAPLVDAGLPDPERWQLIRSALADAPEGIGVLDAALRVVVWNEAASAITGCPAADVVGAVCRLEDGRLILDVNGRVAAAEASRVLPPVTTFFELVVRDDVDPAGRAINVILVPLLNDDFSFFVHLLRQPLVALPWRERRGLGGRRSNGAALRAAATGSLQGLTRREREILRLLAGGKTAKPIAVELRLSVPTVRTHIQHILRKLGVHSCLEAAICFLRATGSESNGHHREASP
jgi:DNA-binding CsgD family transcriptional regulator